MTPLKISIDLTVLITGLCGLLCMIMFWYFCVSGAAFLVVVIVLALFSDISDAYRFCPALIFSLFGIIITFWTGRGILIGRKASAILAIFIVLAIDIFPMFVNMFSDNTSSYTRITNIIREVVIIIACFFLVMSFRDRNYWRRDP